MRRAEGAVGEKGAFDVFLCLDSVAVVVAVIFLRCVYILCECVHVRVGGVYVRVGVCSRFCPYRLGSVRVSGFAISSAQDASASSVSASSAVRAVCTCYHMHAFGVYFLCLPDGCSVVVFVLRVGIAWPLEKNQHTSLPLPFKKHHCVQTCRDQLLLLFHGCCLVGVVSACWLLGGCI